MSEKGLPMTAGFTINVQNLLRTGGASEDVAFGRSLRTKKFFRRDLLPMYKVYTVGSTTSEISEAMKTPSSEEYLQNIMLPKLMYRKSISSEGNSSSEVLDLPTKEEIMLPKTKPIFYQKIS
ncbi:hypothetical protein E3N88_29795 [Mikania micrantha]|uniref:Uncharacterized protein n=1 Tax=Mikania micrantha TaxID=192012 RepID=A0A5N6MKK0_9ASTR|nr:hypothetical protein E3N88_29795 [Mikania micrantha]